MITKVCPNNFLNSFCPNLGIACQYFLLRLDAIHSLKLRTDEEFQAVTKDLTSSSKFSGSCVLTSQTLSRQLHQALGQWLQGIQD